MGQDRAGLVDPLAGSSPDQDRDFFMSIPHDTLIGSGWYILFETSGWMFLKPLRLFEESSGFFSRL
jgi:hypothetical protein